LNNTVQIDCPDLELYILPCCIDQTAKSESVMKISQRQPIHIGHYINWKKSGSAGRTSRQTTRESTPVLKLHVGLTRARRGRRKGKDSLAKATFFQSAQSIDRLSLPFPQAKEVTRDETQEIVISIDDCD
jgi:hypothetical protein